MALYISMNTPSQDLVKSPIDEAISFIATHVAIEKRKGRLPQTGPVLDVTFMLSTKSDVATVLQDVVDNASDYFAENNIKFDTDYWKRAIAYITESEGVPGNCH